MGPKAFHFRRRTILAGLLVCGLCPTTILPAAQNRGQAPAKLDENVFDDRAAILLMNQISDGLVARNQRQMLGAFDIAKMTDGLLFRQQIDAFFGQTGTIRVHFNLTHAGMEDGKGVATVNLEMEAELRDDTRTPIRKQAELRFIAEKSADGWRFTDIAPRAFFSTAQP